MKKIKSFITTKEKYNPIDSVVWVVVYWLALFLSGKIFPQYDFNIRNFISFITGMCFTFFIKFIRFNKKQR